MQIWANLILACLVALLCCVVPVEAGMSAGDVIALLLGLTLGILGICACIGKYARSRGIVMLAWTNKCSPLPQDKRLDPREIRCQCCPLHYRLAAYAVLPHHQFVICMSKSQRKEALQLF